MEDKKSTVGKKEKKIDKKAEKKSEILYNTSEWGAIRVDEEVVSAITAYTTLATDGVADMQGGMTDGITEMFGKKTPGKGVRLEHGPEGLFIDVSILAHYGYAIPDLAFHIQKTVKEQVYRMTGLSVSAVNVTVQGLVFGAGDKAAPLEEDAHE